SSNPDNYAYWEKYLDYVLVQCWVGEFDDTPAPSGGGGGGGGSSEPPPPPPPSAPSGAITPFRWFEYAARRKTFPRVIGAVTDASNIGAARLLLTPHTFGAIQQTPGIPRRGSNAGIYVPDSKDFDTIVGFNNPNDSIYSGASAPWAWTNRVGYITYTQFLLDWGRDRSPLYDNDANVAVGGAFKTQLSAESPFCPLHSESVGGGAFNFPPSEQPMHAVRLALIAAIEEVRQRNIGLAPGAGDRVSVITFDAADATHAPQVRVSLTENFSNAKQACTTLQAVSDMGNSTATENGLALAREHLKPTAQGGAARSFTTKVIVLCTDGVPNIWQSDTDSINGYIAGHASPDYYGGDYPWYNGALMQVAQAEAERTKTFGVGMGLGADLEFLDRVARIAETDENGISPRGTDDPSDYEAQLTNIFKKIINNRGGRLVK
ncbi:MAG TPA: vWA domain-containing protein, partial [Planctomycetaceae bacterium]|nr:vWA domain-containing protein [Planctomycetaceae bacterium]